ncbi:MAG: NAD(P)H-dependent oxidoreductase subunit E [Clostridia bacterium]|nr:NAD(P)H-dependent oxidoreductase subunit E [Clostridia bacterium]
MRRRQVTMSNNFVGTAEQDKAFDEVLKELENVPGPLMKALQKAQEIYGYLPIEVQTRIADKFDVPLEEIYGIATFYSQFNLNPKGKYTIGICLGTACYVKGSGDVLNKFKEKLGIDAGQTTPDRKFTLDATRCIGCCGLAPVLTVNEEVYGKVTVDDVDKILAKYND